MANEKYILSQEQLKKAHSIVDFAVKQDDALKAKVRELFTPEVLGNKAFYNAARNEMEAHAVKSRNMAPQSARTFVYRLLARADIQAPGKNAGTANGNSAERTEAVDTSEAALLAAYRECDWKLCRAIIRTAESAKAASQPKAA